MNNLDALRFDSNGLIPAIVQESTTQEVLMLGYMNSESLRVTFEKRLVTFWSRSRNELWTKGETSGNTLELVEVSYDCDADALLVKAKLNGDAVCHTGARSCFFTTIDSLK